MSSDADTLNRVTAGIIAAAVRIHRSLGPGLLENPYLSCLSYELSSAGLRYELQKAIPLVYNGVGIKRIVNGFPG